MTVSPPTERPLSSLLPRPRERARASAPRPSGVRAERWAGALYVIALLLVYFQTNVAERMAERLLPVAALLLLVARPRRELLTRTVPLALVGFLVWAGASWLWSPDRGGSQIVLLTFVSQVIVAWCCGSFLSLSTLHRLTTRVAQALCLLTVGFLVLAYSVSTRPAEDGAPGWHGPFSHKNGLGAFLVLALLCFWFDRRMKRSHRIAWIVLGLVLLIGTQSSTALALVLVSLAVVLWDRRTGPATPLWQRVGWLAALLAVLGTVALLLATKFSVITGLLGRGSSLSGRTNIWSVVTERIGEKPFFGWGFGGEWRPESLVGQSMWREMRFHAYHAHSGYLDLLLQVGIVGLVLYLAFVLGGMVRHWKLRALPAASGTRVHLWATLVMLTFCLNAVTESAPFFSDGLLLLVGLAVAREVGDPVRRSAAARTASATAPSEGGARMTPAAGVTSRRERTFTRRHRAPLGGPT